jgi:rod shape determining protein RodA
MTLTINRTAGRRAGAAARAARFPILGHVDPILTGATIAIAVIGAVMVFSATRGPGEDQPLTTYFFTRQAMFVVLGIGIYAAASFFDYRHLRDWALPLAVGTAGLLFLVVFLGASSKGGQRSFAFAGFQLQPSEFAKVVFVIGLASFLTYDREEVEMDNRRLGLCLGLTALPIGLIMLQPDLGTALVFGVTALAMLTVAGAKPKQMAVLFGAAALCIAAVLMSGILAEYQQDRLTVFVDPSQDTQGAAYNQNQSQKTIGSGGLAGQGLFEGRQTGLGFVPEQHTDFIFTVVGEELGFMGSALLLVLFGLVLWRTWRTAHLAREPFGMLVCVGVMGIFMFQIFENAGMAMGIMPVTGIPLPLVSYGGSSVIAMFLALGIVHSVHMHRFS